MISFMVPTKPDWNGMVLSTQSLSYNSEFVNLPSWYRPQVCWSGVGPKGSFPGAGLNTTAYSPKQTAQFSAVPDKRLAS